MFAGWQPANVALASKIGKACSSVFTASDLANQGYLGASPNAVKGGGGKSLANWKGAGTASFAGTLVTTAPSKGQAATAYYECGFEISGLPTADIVEISTAGALSGDNKITERYFEASVPTQIVLDHEWKPVSAAQGAQLNNVGACSGGGGSAGGGLSRNGGRC